MDTKIIKLKEGVNHFSIDGHFRVYVNNGNAVLIPETACFIQHETKDIARFQHDCDKCIFLGQYKEGVANFDLYFCPNEPTVVARYANSGPSYKSGLFFADEDTALKEARRLAIEIGLLK